jgi:hypothetical protein
MLAAAGPAPKQVLGGRLLGSDSPSMSALAIMSKLTCRRRGLCVNTFVVISRNPVSEEPLKNGLCKNFLDDLSNSGPTVRRHSKAVQPTRLNRGARCRSSVI